MKKIKKKCKNIHSKQLICSFSVRYDKFTYLNNRCTVLAFIEYLFSTSSEQLFLSYNQ